MNSIKFTVVGDSETGKTCWLSVLKGDDLRMAGGRKRLEPFMKKIVVNGTEYQIEICDTIGHNTSLKDRLKLYRNTDVFLICFAENDTISFKNVVTRWYPEVKGCVPTASIVLVCTKCDIKSRRIPEEEIANVRKKCYFSHSTSCSAYSKENLEDVFRKTIMELFEVPPPKKPFYHKLFFKCNKSKTSE